MRTGQNPTPGPTRRSSSRTTLAGTISLSPCTCVRDGAVTTLERMPVGKAMMTMLPHVVQNDAGLPIRRQPWVADVDARIIAHCGV